MSLAELTRNAAHVLPEGALEPKLALGRPLRVKLGIDVTAPDVTLGNGIPLQRMAAFQRAGHVGVLIVGDYTTRIGDPSGRSAARPILSVRRDRRERETLRRAGVDDHRSGAHRSPLQRRVAGEARLRRDPETHADDHRRADPRAGRLRQAPARARADLVSELLYPLMQAYDSVAVEADVELGGTDQLYNLLAGREVMEAYGLEPQVALTVEYLVSWDGAGMSASRGNYIGLDEDATNSSARRCAFPTTCSSSGIGWSWSPTTTPSRAIRCRPRSRSRAGSSLARTGKRLPPRPSAHFTRVVREGQAPEDVPEAALPPGRPAPSTGAAGRALRALDQRRPPADLPGWSEDRRCGGRRARPRARRAQRSARTGGKAPFRPLYRLTRTLVRAHSEPRKCATILPSPERVAQESCHSTNWSAFERTHTTSVVPPRSLCRESEVFCCRQQSGSVFENSTA